MYELEGDEVRERRTGRRPEHAHLVYVHRPVDELPSVVDDAKEVGARAVWCHNGSAQAREIVEAAGLTYVDDPPIVEAVHALHVES